MPSHVVVMDWNPTPPLQMESLGLEELVESQKLEPDPGTSWPSGGSCAWQPCWPFLHRLLKVKPEERLTIEGVLDHPWLNSTEALDNVLPSAQLMMDKVLNDILLAKKAVLRRNAGA